MTIRLAKKDDYLPLMELYNLFVGDDRYSKVNNDSFLRVLNNPQNYIYVAEDKEKIVGFATFSVRDVVRYPKSIAELDELFVLKDNRKKGVGKKLMDEVEKQAKKLDCYRIFIESHYDHKVAHHFYENLAYKNYGYHFIKDL
jgi:GNAT superfamily N-acetyltransferase